MTAIAQILVILFAQLPDAHAFKDQSIYAGIGYNSENVLGRITKSPSSASSQTGSASYPLLLKYDLKLSETEQYFSPSLTYTPIGRSQAGNAAKITSWQIILPYGQRILDTEFDWYAGLGLVSRTIKGAGGTVQLSNGTGTSTFARPGGSSETRNLLLHLGSAYNFGNSRFAIDLNVESALTTKRSYDFMVSYSYAFWGMQL